MTLSTDLAASIAAIAEDMGRAMRTYERCPPGGRVREDLVTSVSALHERLSHLIHKLEHEDEGDRIAQDEEEHRYDPERGL